MFGERILGVALNSKVLWRNCTMKTLPVEKRANIQQVRTLAPPQYHYNSHIAAEYPLQSIQLKDVLSTFILIVCATKNPLHIKMNFGSR